MDDDQAVPSGLTRRRALTGAAGLGLGLPVLAACGGSGAPANTVATDPAPPSSGTAQTPGTRPAGGALATTADIEVGGATIFAEAGVVVSQPSAGEFRGFSVTCTHQGCPVDEVVDDEVRCPCHGSTFSIVTGEPTSGPASAPLATIELQVSGDQITVV